MASVIDIRLTESVWPLTSIPPRKVFGPNLTLLCERIESVLYVSLPTIRVSMWPQNSSYGTAPGMMSYGSASFHFSILEIAIQASVVVQCCCCVIGRDSTSHVAR